MPRLLVGFRSGGEDQERKGRQDLVFQELRRALPPEFINRIDEIIVFDPLTDDELESGNLPKVILEQRHKLFGLTISPERLREIRRERRSVGKYASSQQVRYELREAKRIFDRYKIPSVDTTKFSIEEIASRILDHTGVERRVRI